MILQGEDVLLQLAEGHRPSPRGAVADDVQVPTTEIHHAFSGRILDVSVPDVPFLRYGPISNARVPVGTSAVTSAAYLTGSQNHRSVCSQAFSA
jgi:hypothetical protein